MPYHLALLRGINVGKARRIPMAELRSLLTGLGYADVTTLLNSGNAVFQAPAIPPAQCAATIAAALHTRFGENVPVIVLSARDLAQIVAANPISVPPTEHSRLLVAFVQDPATLPELSSLHTLVTAPEQFVLGKQAAYLHCANGILDSAAGKALLGKAGRSATSRNWATVLKLQHLCAGTKA